VIPVCSAGGLLDTIGRSCSSQAPGAVGHRRVVFVVSGVAGGTAEATDVLPDGTATWRGDRGPTRIAIKVATARTASSSAASRIRRGRVVARAGQLLLVAHVVGAAHEAFASVRSPIA
jgi:hypothetical protein